VFTLLISQRIAVGLCDLLLAGTMYFLFLLLQGGVPAHHRWWVPTTGLEGALVTAALVLLRVLMDLLSTRSVVGQIQDLYSQLLLRLIHGYGELRWDRFVERNRSELLKHSTSTALEAANFYHLYIELTAALVVVAVMAATVLYQSPAVACGLGGAVAVLYAVHRFLLRKKLRLAVAEREQSLRLLQRNLSDMFSGGKEIRTYGNQSFFQDRIRTLVGSAGASNVRFALLPQISEFSPTRAWCCSSSHLSLWCTRHGDAATAHCCVLLCAVSTPDTSHQPDRTRLASSRALMGAFTSLTVN
jgi:ABC-type multidrug transport system fused ATPase/permease subunit